MQGSTVSTKKKQQTGKAFYLKLLCGRASHIVGTYNVPLWSDHPNVHWSVLVEGSPG